MVVREVPIPSMIKAGVDMVQQLMEEGDIVLHRDGLSDALRIASV
jgi:hypothetical protein